VSYILYEAPGYEHGPWNLEVMRKIARLTTALEDEVPFVYEVKTLVNAELMRGHADGIDVFELEDHFPETQAELLALRPLYLDTPLLVGGLVSGDATHGGIVIEMDRSSTDPLDEIRLDPEGGDDVENLYPQVTDSVIEAILARPEFDGIDFYHSGDVPLNSVYNRVITSESQRLGAITSGVIAVVLALSFRSLVGVLGPLVVVQISVILCVALIALLGWTLDLVFSSAPTLLTAIGVAHSVHILSEFRARFRQLGDRREALVQTIYLVGTPCLLTSVTTAVGFAAMSFVPIKSVAHSGTYTAFGVLAAFAMSITLLMALLSFGRRTGVPAGPEGVDRGGQRVEAALAAVAAFDVRHRRSILAVFAALFVASLAGVAQLVVDSNWLNDFSDRMPIKAETERIDRVMGGTTNLVYLFDAGVEDGIKDPAVLREIERVQRLGEAHPTLVRKTYSIVDVLKDLNRAFHGGDPDWYRIPETRELVAQYLILYEMSGGEDAEEYVSPDYRRASLELRLKLGPFSEMAELADGIGAELAARPLEVSTVDVTGIGALWLKLMGYIVSSQVIGFSLAFGAISLMMVAVLRSLRVGVISMVPNLAPVALSLGAMGWFGILLDYSKVSIAAVAIGIAVDDTIHLVLRYRHEFLRRGSYHEALVAAMQDVGRALLITSVALVCGFLVLTLSVLDTQTTQGVLLAATIVSALVADFLLMPALVLTWKPFGPEDARSHAERLPEAA
jgi:predicted RND superfamily exporter protein